MNFSHYGWLVVGVVFVYESMGVTSDRKVFLLLHIYLWYIQSHSRDYIGV